MNPLNFQMPPAEPLQEMEDQEIEDQDFTVWPIPGFKEADQNCGNCQHVQLGGEQGAGSCGKVQIVNPLEDLEKNWCVHWEA